MGVDLAKAESIFIAALRLPDEERRGYIVQACGDDVDLQRQIESLIAAKPHAESFLERGPLDLGAIGDAPAWLESVGDYIGSYKLLEQIGEGGFGVVFRAEQTEPVRREVALKIIKPGMDTRDVVTRFEAERQALAMMDHSHIAKVFDAGTTDTGRPYFAMELVKGIPITEYCNQCSLSTLERLELFVQVCQAVQHAHQKGIIHRDLKPTNVLVAMQDGVLAPKIIDFGVAKAMGARLTEHTLVTAFAQMVGTPLYMSPEQAEMSPLEVDTRTDVYSLGVLLYELLTSTTPFEKQRLKEASFDELRRIIREEEPPAPSARISTLNAADQSTVAEHRRTEPCKLGQLVRGELDWIVMKCLEKDRHRRYASAKDLADDVERYLHDEPVLARPTGTMYRVRKFVRRNRGLVAAVAAVLVALCLGLITTTAGFLTAQRRLVQVEEERARSEEERDNYETVTQLIRDAFKAPPGQEVQTTALAVGDLLNELSDGLRQRAPDRPKVEIELRRIVAELYSRIGKPGEASEHLRRALELAEGEGGFDPYDEKYADLLVDLAGQSDWGSKSPFDPIAQADCARRALAIYRALGIESGATADACVGLANSLRSAYTTPPPECEQLYRRALAISSRLGDSKDPIRHVLATGDLARHLSFAEADGSEDAINYAMQASQLSEKAYGTDAPITAITYRWLGVLYFRLGRIDEAIDSFEKAWVVFKDTGRKYELEAHESAFRLAEACVFAGRHHDANRICLELEAVCRGQEDWERLVNFMGLRGWSEYLRGDYRAAVEILSAAAVLVDEHLGPYHGTQGVRLCLTDSLNAMGMTAEAEQASQKVLTCVEAWARASDRENYQVLWANAWALVRAKSGDTPEGRRSLESAIQKAQSGLRIVRAAPAIIWESPYLWAQAMAEYKLGRKEAAITTMNDAISSITRPYPSIQGNGNQGWSYPSKDVPRPRREMEATLAAYYLEVGNVEDSERVFIEGIEFRKSFTDRVFPAKELQVALAVSRYGDFLLQRGRFDDAQKQYEVAFEKLNANPEAAKATTERAANGYLLSSLLDVIIEGTK